MATLPSELRRLIESVYFAARFALAHRAFCAAAIRARPAALIVRLLGLDDRFATVMLAGPPSNRAFTSRSL